MIVCFLLGCTEQHNSAVQNPSENTVDSGCDNTPKMTNAQIIADTQTCESAGLDAEGFHCGTNPTTIQIQCKPRAKE